MGPLEPLENPLLVAGGDPGPLVGNCDGRRSRGPREAQVDRAIFRRIADRVADEVHEDLDDGAFLAACAQRFGSRRDRYGLPRSSADDSSMITASAESDGKIEDRLPLRGIVAHRAEDRQQVPRSRSDIVAVARIVAAQRPVGAGDDPLGAFDDAVDRGAQQLVQRMIEGRGSRARRMSGRILLAFGGAAEAREAAVGRSHDFALEHNKAVRRPSGCARAGR